MKIIPILMTAVLALSAIAQTTNAQTSDTTAAKKKAAAKTPEPPSIPADAVALGDGTFRYTDKAGKNWIYSRTPFGVSKAEERPVVKAVGVAATDPTMTKDQGDSVEFTRPTPFGNKTWTKKKTELDDYEKGLVDRDQQKREGTTSQNAAGSSKGAAAKQE